MNRDPGLLVMVVVVRRGRGRGRHNHSLLVMMVVMVVVVMMMLIGRGDDDLRQLEPRGRIEGLRAENVRGVRNGVEQLGVGLRRL